MATLTQALAYSALFGGRRDARGSIEDKCVREIVTPIHFLKHLSGEVSLGIYLLTEDICYFAAIDIDEPRFELALELKVALYDRSVPSHIARSRSGNHHLYVFSDSCFKAVTIRRVLQGVAYKQKMWSPNGTEAKQWATERGMKHPVEIFPKQDSVRTAPGGLGNFIHLPFFGDQRPFLDSRGNPVTLEFFLENVRVVSSRTE